MGRQMNETMKKVTVKCYDDSLKSMSWVHLCYVQPNLWASFKKKLSDERSLNDFLSKWAAEDFGVTLKVNSIEDLSELKALIKNKAQTQYPHIYLKTNIDSQGWIRVWVQEHLMKERNKK